MVITSIQFHHTVTLDPTTRDPYESKMVEICGSEIAGANEGLFAKVSMEVNTVIAFYNGVKARPEDFDPDSWEKNNYRIFDPANAPEGTIDIPVWAQVVNLFRKSKIVIYFSPPLLTVPLLLTRPTTASCQMPSLLFMTTLSLD